MTSSGGDLGAQKYLRLTTFRRSGAAVPTPVWVVPDGDDLLVFTDLETGKVKRLRHTAQVLLTPCDGRGRVEPGTADVPAVAEVFDDPEAIARLRALVIAKYGLLARIFYRLAPLAAAVRRAPQTPAGLRITPARPGAGDDSTPGPPAR